MGLFASSFGEPWRTWEQLNLNEKTEGEWKYVIRGNEPNLYIVRIGPNGAIEDCLSPSEVPESLKEHMVSRLELYERTRCHFLEKKPAQ